MNLGQRIAACIGLLVEAVMLVFPPWYNYYTGTVYRFILAPSRMFALDAQRLIFQSAIVAILTIAIIVLLGTKKSR